MKHETPVPFLGSQQAQGSHQSSKSGSFYYKEVAKYFTYHKIYQQCLHLVMKGCWLKFTEVESYHCRSWDSHIFHQRGTILQKYIWTLYPI